MEGADLLSIGKKWFAVLARKTLLFDVRTTHSDDDIRYTFCFLWLFNYGGSLEASSVKERNPTSKKKLENTESGARFCGLSVDICFLGPSRGHSTQ